MALSVGGACRTPARPAGTSTATRRGALLPARNTRDTGGQSPARRFATGCPPTPGGSMFTSPDEVAAYIRDNDVEFVDVRFCDLPGVMQHFTIPASTFGEDTLDRKSTRLNSSHANISYAVFCLKKKKKTSRK